VVDPSWSPRSAEFDAVVVVDVLYLLGIERATALLAAAAAAVRPGGVVVVKEMAADPRWKHRWNLVQEQIAVRLVGITEGVVVEIVPEAALRAAMAAGGLDVDRRELHRGYPHPHLALVGSRPWESGPR
jgi:2-polyprenyl-3-methyl-5-hydroxy-6-metoxy-1,4-benzoquinol methylase